MRRHITLAIAASALLGASALGMGSSGALAGDHPLTLSPTTPVEGQGFTASGTGCDVAQQHTTLQNLLTGNNHNGSDEVPVAGAWTSSWDATWNDDGPGWYQAIASCSATPEADYWTSDIFLAQGAADLLPLSFHAGDPTDPDELAGWVYATGSGCQAFGSIYLSAYDATDNEVYDLSGNAGSDGAWQLAVGQGTPPAGLHWIGGCFNNQLGPLYEANGTSLGSTPETPDTPDTTDTPTATPDAPAAQPVAAEPSVTG